MLGSSLSTILKSLHKITLLLSSGVLIRLQCRSLVGLKRRLRSVQFTTRRPGPADPVGPSRRLPGAGDVSAASPPPGSAVNAGGAAAWCGG